MPRLLHILLACALGLAVRGGTAGENRPIPIRDLFRPARLHSPKINSTGTYVAALSTADDLRTSLLFYDIATQHSRRMRPGSYRDVYSFAWLDATHVLFDVTTGKRYAEGLLVTDIRKPNSPLCLNAYDATEFVGTPRSDPLKPFIWIRHSSRHGGAEDGILQLDATVGFQDDRSLIIGYYSGPPNSRVNIIRRLPVPRDDVISYFPDQFGDLAYAVTAPQGVPTLHRWRDPKWQKCPVDLEDIEPCGIGSTADELIAHGPRQAGQPRSIQRLNTVTGEFGRLIYQDPKYDIEITTIHRRDATGEILGFNCSDQGPRTIWLDSDYRALQSMLEYELPGSVVRCAGFDRAEKMLVVEALSDRHPGTVYLFDRASSVLTMIANTAPWIDPARMRQTQLVAYRTRDGLDLGGLLTLPGKTANGKLPPLVVMPADEPTSTLSWAWDANAQFFASRGYAVFRPNHRGAGIYHWKSAAGVEWDFRKLHDDVTDAVQALARSGVIDREKIAIMGRSFGAYLALCGTTYEPELYRCAIGVDGVYDWVEALNETGSNIHYTFAHDFMKRHLGNPDVEIAKYASISPLRHVASLKHPVLVARGYDDEGVTSARQGKLLVSALKTQRATVEVVVASGPDPDFSEPENQFKLATAVESFLARHLSGDGRK